MALGELRVDFVANIAAYVADMGKVAAQTEATARRIERAFNSATTGLVTFGKSLAGALGVSVSAAGVVALLEQIKEKTQDSERSVAQLNAVLLATGGAAGLTSDALGKLGRSVRDSTIFSDEDIRKAETALLRFRSVQKDVFENALKLVPDLAAALGVDIPTAAVAMGKALEGTGGQMRLLKSAGLSLSQQNIDLAARMDEAGNKAGAQRLKLEELQKSIGGAAAADTTGLYGATMRLSRAFGELEIAAGKKIFVDHALIEGSIGLLDRWRDAIDKAHISLNDILTLKTSPYAAATEALRALTGGDTGGTRLVKGKISGIADPAETDAFMKAVNAKIQEAYDQQYIDQKTALQRLAANSAAYYTKETQLQKFNLDVQDAQLAFAYERGNVSVEAFFDKRRALEAKAANDSQVILSQQIAIQERVIAATSSDRSVVDAARAKILALTDASVKLGYDRDLKVLALDNQQILANEKLSDTYAELAAKRAEAAGDTATGAVSSFDIAHRVERNALEAKQAASDGLARINAAQALRDLDTDRERVKIIAQLADKEKEFATILGTVEVAQARIDLAVQTGNDTEIGGLVKRGEAAQKYIAGLARVADAYEAIALKSGDPKMLLAADQLRLKIEQLAAQSDALAAKFRDIFESNFADALLAIETRTKSLKTAITDLAKGLEHDLLQVANKNIAEQVFGKGGFLGAGGSGFDVSGFVAKLFGGKGILGSAGDATGAVALTGAGASLTASSIALDASAAALSAAAAALSVGSAASAGSGLSSLFGGAVDSGFGLFASGGDPPIGKYAIVGEHGPELIRPRSAVNVVPNDVLMARRGQRGANISITQHINVMPGASRASAEQAAAAQYAETRRALSRIA